MTQFFAKKLNKKGFTLAELLIVVAIIAILVAIAVPIFMGALDEAQLRTNQANVRTVKEAGVAAILTDWAKNKPLEGTHGWKVTATVNSSGEIKLDKIEKDDVGYLGGTGITATIDGAWYSDLANSDFAKKVPDKTDGYKVVVLLTNTDLNPSTPDPGKH